MSRHFSSALATLGLVITSSTVLGQWSNAALVNTAADRAAGQIKYPEIYPASGGGFHCRFLTVDSTCSVRYRRYQNGSFGNTVVIATRPGLTSGGDICEALDGSLHAVWEDWQGTPNVGWARSTNGGASWSSSIITSLGDIKFPWVAPFGTGSSPDVITSYYRTVQNQLYFQRWDGSSWTSPATFQAADSEYYISGMCRSPVDGSIYRSYGRKINSTTWRVAYRRYNGSGWDPEVVVHDTQFFARPEIAVNQSGHVMVIWEQNGHIYARLNTGTWGSIVDLGDCAFGDVVAVPGTNDFYCAYGDYVSGSPQRVRGRHFTGGSWGSEETISNGLGNGFTVNVRLAIGADLVPYCTWEYHGTTSEPAPNAMYSVRSALPGGNPLPVVTNCSISSGTLVANDTTQYTVTLSASDASGVSDIKVMRVMFNLDLTTPSNARGYLAWGETAGDVTYWGGSWTTAAATGGGVWGYRTDNYGGTTYITPVGASMSTSGNQRTVVFTFRVKNAWATTGPWTNNWIGHTVGDNGSQATPWAVAPGVSYGIARGTISGTITASTGGPISGATVTTSTGGYSATTNSNGQYTISNVIPGTYTITASKANYNNATSSPFGVSSGATSTVNLSLVPLPGTLTGTVTASGGGPIAGATVTTNVGGYSATTNGSGVYTISNVTPGTYNVTASATGYTPSTVNGVVVNPNATTTQNFTLSPSAPTNYVLNGDCEGGFFDTGWGGGSKLPNNWGWFNPGDFNAFEESSIVHGGTRSSRTTYSSGGNASGGGIKRGICQAITVPASAAFTIKAWARHTNGNCPSIMAWNPGVDPDPENAYANGRYKWITTDNWGQLNTWVFNTLSGTAPSSGVITVIIGGAHHGGGGNGTIYIDDVEVTSP